jgi:hypothetical protein
MAAARSIVSENTDLFENRPGDMSAAPHDTDPIVFAARLRVTGLGRDGTRLLDDLLQLAERSQAFDALYPEGPEPFRGATDHISRIKSALYVEKLALLFELGGRLQAENGARIRDMQK